MKLILLFITLSFLVIGCRPEEEPTQFNATDIQGLIEDPLLDNYCALPPAPDLSNEDNIETCQMQQGCQAVLGGDSVTYVGCIPNSDPSGSDDGSGDYDSSDDDLNSDNEPGVSHPDSSTDNMSFAQASCHKNGKKVFVCHRCNGKHREHTLCISINGWFNGHEGTHTGHWDLDYLGPCQ